MMFIQRKAKEKNICVVSRNILIFLRPVGRQTFFLKIFYKEDSGEMTNDLQR